MKRGLHKATEAHSAYVKAELSKRQWWARCWNCGNRVEGTLKDLTGHCPHCGVLLRERNGSPAD